MKKIFVFTLLLILTTTTFSQQTTPSPTLTKQDYLQKSKHQKTAALIMLGGGATLFIVGGVIAAHDVVDIFSGHLQNANNETAVILSITGAAALLGSIPLFIASSKNKKKGMSLSFKNEMIPSIVNNNPVYQSVPAISLRLKL